MPVQARRRPYYEAVDACCMLFSNNLPSLLAIVGGLYRFVASGDIVGVCAIGSVVGRIEAYECAAHNLHRAAILVFILTVDYEFCIAVSLKHTAIDIQFSLTCNSRAFYRR